MDAISSLSRLRLGRDIAVAGYEAPVIHAFQRYPMTALAQPAKDLALDTICLLMCLIETPDMPIQNISHLPSLNVRASTLRRPETPEDGAT